MIPESEIVVSVIVPCYNYGHFLPETLSCIANQTCNKWECLIIDDGSTDDTAHVAKRFVEKDARFKYYHQQNGGLSDARNTGIKLSKGSFLQFLDADDLIHKYKLDLQAMYLQNHTAVDIVYADSLFFETQQPNVYFKGKQAKDIKAANKPKISGRGLPIIKELLINNIFTVSAPLIRRTVFEDVGYFDLSYTAYEDWQFWFRCATRNKYFEYAPLSGTETYIRMGHASMMTNKKKMVRNGIRLRKFMNLLLPLKLKPYNWYRLLKLSVKNRVTVR
jgi:glycosyltransferase involved in cell wall biosynthesis